MCVYSSGSLTSLQFKLVGLQTLFWFSIMFPDILLSSLNFKSFGPKFHNLLGLFFETRFLLCLFNLKFGSFFRTYAIRDRNYQSLKLRSEIRKYAQNDNSGVEKYALESGKVGSPEFVSAKLVCYFLIYKSW